MKRSLLAVLSVASLLGIAAPAAASSRGPDITCVAGFFRITNHYTDVKYGQNGAGITGNGQGNYVSYLAVAGSCFEVYNPYVDGNGHSARQYRNEGGSCLQLVNGYQALEPCGVAGTPSQTFYPFSYTAGIGWVMDYEVNGKNWDMGHRDCSNGEDIGADSLATCWGWNFPA